MRDLVCQRCARVLIVDFWALVEAESVPMFSSFSLTCSCGAVVAVDPLEAERRIIRVPFGRWSQHHPAVIGGNLS